MRLEAGVATRLASAKLLCATLVLSLVSAPLAWAQNWDARCLVCPRPLAGQVRVITLGDQNWRLHAEHPVPTFCLYCEHPLVTGGPYGGPIRYPDGRVVCSMCQASAINDPQDAQRRLDRVRATMTRWGMQFPWGQIPVRLVVRGS
jgi:hypothetical protein